MQAIPQLDQKGLRKFGLTTAAIIVALFGLLLPWLRERPVPLWPWAIAVVLSIWAVVAPGSLNLVYRPWMNVGLILGWINTRIILGLVFLVIIWPLGVLLRLMKERKVARIINGFETSARTYWLVPPAHPTSMEKPF